MCIFEKETFFLCIQSLAYLGVKGIKKFNLINLRNGKHVACVHRVMDARGRLLSTKEAAESDSSFLSA